MPGNDGVTQVFESKLYFPIDRAPASATSTTTAKTAEPQLRLYHRASHEVQVPRRRAVFVRGRRRPLWCFIDKKLAIDLGGIAAPVSGKIVLDEFAAAHGLAVGQVYSLDIFNAERHPSGSRLQVTTSMTFVDCGVSPVVK